MTALVVMAVLVVLAGSIALARWIADQERWEERAEEARADRELHRADRRIRGLTNRTILSMLEVTRKQDIED